MKNVDKQFYSYLKSYLLPNAANVGIDAVLTVILWSAPKHMNVVFAVDGIANLLVSALKAWGIYDGAQAAKEKCRC